MTWLALAVAGGVGAVVRDRVAHVLRTRREGQLLATALVNLVGALALGTLVGAHLSATVLTVAGTGLLGGLTTFSTWLVQASRTTGWAARWSVVAGQLVAGPLLAAFGIWLGGSL